MAAFPNCVNCFSTRYPAFKPVRPAWNVLDAACVAVAVALPPQNDIPVAPPDVLTYMFPLNWFPAVAQHGNNRSEPLSVKVTSLFQRSGLVFPRSKKLLPLLVIPQIPLN